MFHSGATPQRMIENYGTFQLKIAIQSNVHFQGGEKMPVDKNQGNVLLYQEKRGAVRITNGPIALEHTGHATRHNS